MKTIKALLPMVAFLVAVAGSFASISVDRDTQVAQGYDIENENCVPGEVDASCVLNASGNICKMISTNIDAKDPSEPNCVEADLFRENTP